MSKDISRLILTASEEVCDALESQLKGQPGVLATFQNSGFWYSNGETGPEWFTITIEADYSKKEAIEALVHSKLDALDMSVQNMFWG